MNTETGKLKVLILEDNLYDVELTKRELKRAQIGCECFIANSQETFIQNLLNVNPDLILADYHLPQFNGIAALEIAKKHDPYLPFIVVTGAIDEETAAETIKAGAWDYVVKDRLFRLGPVVTRALNEKNELLDKVNAEKALNEFEEMFRGFMESTAAGFSFFDENLYLKNYNETAQQIFSPEKKEIRGLHLKDIAKTAIESDKYANYKNVIETGKPYSTEIIISSPKSNPIYVSIKAFKVGNGMGIISTDITDQKKIENALRISEERYRTLIESSGQPIFMLDYHGKINLINQNAAKQLRKSQNDILGKTIFQVIPEPIASDFIKLVHTVIENKKEIFTETPVEIQNSKYWFESRIYPILSDNDIVNNVLVLITDITSRKDSEAELELLAEAINHSIEIVMIADNKNIIKYVNPAFEKITGYNQKTAIGSTSFDFLGIEENKNKIDKIWSTINAGNKWSGNLVYKRSNGVLFEGESTFSPITDKNGKLLHFVNVIRDVTDEKKLEKQLRQTQKLETIGTLAGGIAHDFNNILVPILGYSELLVERVPTDSNLKKYIEHIIKAGYRAKDLINQILTFSRRVEQERRPIYIQTIVKEVLKLLRASIPSSIEIDQRIDSNCKSVLADPTQIHQVIMNLSVNAFHAMRNTGGTLIISLSMVDMDKTSPEFKLPADQYVKLIVQDTGEGMEASTLDRIFEPFFTTKNDEGTGLGLSVVHGIILSHDGEITVESTPGTGTTFNLYFPVHIDSEEIKEQSKDLPVGSEKILFVDDEVEIVELNKQILEQLGYTATVTTDSIEALELFKSNPDEFDLVFTDFTMPKMNGVKLAQEVSQIKPGLPVILCTGYSENITMEKAKELGITEFVFKPLTMSSIAQIIRQALDSR